MTVIVKDISVTIKVSKEDEVIPYRKRMWMYKDVFTREFPYYFAMYINATNL